MIKKRKLLIGLLIFVLFGIVILGLYPRDFNFSNNAHWMLGQPGVRFDKYGIAYADLPDGWIVENDLASADYSIEIALKSNSFDEKGFGFVFTIHDGKDSEQLLMGQWRSSFIVMNGDDYSHKRKTKRISTNVDSLFSKKILLTITTGKAGTRLYVNGQLVRKQGDLTLEIPHRGKTRLTMGNSVHGRHSWRGDIYGFALYKAQLKTKDIECHYNRWCKIAHFGFNRKKNPILLFMFDEKEGHRVVDHGSGNIDLILPKQLPILEKELLPAPWIELGPTKSLVIDMIINVLGFIPLGFILSAIFLEFRKTAKKQYLFITIAICFALSLGIEITQAWLPSRSSQTLDIILNTGGAAIGSLVCMLVMKQSDV